MRDSSSALWKALHKADYAKSFMESSKPEHVPRAVLQRPALNSSLHNQGTLKELISESGDIQPVNLHLIRHFT